MIDIDQTAERLLLTQMLEMGVRDYLDEIPDHWLEEAPDYRARQRVKAHLEARQWIDHERGDEQLPFSLVCSYLELDPEVIRERLRRDRDGIVARFSDKRRAA